jgi:hypothetical protein
MQQVYRPRWDVCMNKQFGRLFLAGVCALIVASAATAQDSSHRLLPDADFGNLAQAQSLLARRLRHQEDVEKLQELVKGLDKVSPKDFKDIQDVIKNHPEFLDNPTVQGVLNAAKKLQQGGADLSPAMKNELYRQAKDFANKLKSQKSSPNPLKGGPAGRTHVAPNNPMQPPETPPPPIVPKPHELGHDIEQDLTDWVKKINSSSEGQALRKAALHDLAKSDAEAPGSPPDLSDFLRHVITPGQASWLSRNLQLPSLPNFDGWSPSPGLSGETSLAGPSSGGGLDAMVWVAALGLFGVAAVLALRAAKRQADGGAKGWSAGPWPVHPSRVSTREDLIRAFEHLAFLCLGPTARHLNHLALAVRLGETDHDRAGPAARLAHLYEQARYAPPDELLPADELTAARSDLSTLAGATA